MNSDVKLKTCPFCGKRAYLRRSDATEGWYVECGCQGRQGWTTIRVWGRTRRQAASRWNRRHNA